MGKGRGQAPARALDGAARVLTRLSGKQVARREVLWLVGLMAVGFAIRVAYILATDGYQLAGDQLEYDQAGRAATQGDWFHSTFPYGQLHESVARPPGYMAWIGALYSLVGADVTKALLVQSLIGPVVIALTWLLARRLFDARVAVVAAGIAAVYPNLWQWEGRLYSESLVLPLSLLIMIVAFEARPTARRAGLVGVVIGLSLLVRPSQIFMFVFVLAAFSIAGGLRRGAAMTALAVAVAALVVSPWTIRNHAVSGAFVPLSLQDAALGGTFNDDAADDPVYPYAWRPVPSRDTDILGRTATPIPETELRDELQSRAIDFIKDHPESVAEAFFWNGLSRTWDIRRPQRVLDEVPFEGREDAVAAAGLAFYWVLLAAALAGLWRQRARRSLVVPILAGAAGMSVVFTVAAGSRYRVPFEPALVLLAASWVVLRADRMRAGRMSDEKTVLVAAS